jgi:DNA polymerase delta subunit 1
MVLDTAVRYSARDKATIVRHIGRTAGGLSVAIFATGWTPHMTIVAPNGWRSEYNDQLELLLEEKLQTRLHGMAEGERMLSMRKIVSHITVVMSETIMGYVHGRGKSQFLRIHLMCPDGVAPMRDCFHGYSLEQVDGKVKKADGIRVVVGSAGVHLQKGATKTFGSNIDPRLQSMVDQGVRGGQWVSVHRDRLCDVTRTTCDMEVDASADELKWHDVETFSGVAPLRGASYDIETSMRKGVFSDSKCDPVIVIGIHFNCVGVSEELLPNPIILCMRECNPIEGVTVICYTDDQEACMIQDAVRIMGGGCGTDDSMLGFDADIVRGWNINNFDWPYLEGRAKQLGVEHAFAHSMSRMRWSPMFIIEAWQGTPQMGLRKCNKIILPGRIGGDMFVYVGLEGFRELKDLKLNTVSMAFLNDEKDPVHFTQIMTMWQGDADSRTQLCKYCLKDAKLPNDISSKLYAVFSVVEKARITGVPCDWVMGRGTMARCNSLVFRSALEHGFVIPYVAPPPPPKPGAPQRQCAEYEGATVLEPDPGVWEFVSILDFNAMYPNIIMKYNLCYTTYTSEKSVPGAFGIIEVNHCKHFFYCKSLKKN